MRAVRHQLVIGRMKLDLVAAVAAWHRRCAVSACSRWRCGRAPPSPPSPNACRTRTIRSAPPPPPLAATASTSGRSTAKRSTSSNGGDWLKTSWVANDAWLMAGPGTVNHFRGANREIIGLPARARQRKVPPLLRIVHKSLPRHHQNQLSPPAALGRGDGFRRRVRLDVGTVVAGAHVDAAVRRAKVHVGGAVAIVLGGIEGGGIVGFQIDQSEIERRAGGMARMGRDVAEPKQVGLAERRIVALAAPASRGRRATMPPCRRPRASAGSSRTSSATASAARVLPERSSAARRPRASPRIRRPHIPSAAGRRNCWRRRSACPG